MLHDVMSPVPSWPQVPSPQQYATPAAVSPQLCWEPAVTATKPSEFGTFTGPAPMPFTADPSCPEVFSPQQYAADGFRSTIAQLCDRPPARANTVAGRSTACGTGKSCVGSFGLTSPLVLEPQQYATPLVVIAQELCNPETMDVAA